MPDGEVSKYKARYCVRGDLEESKHETFAPVVSWSTVRIFLALSLTLKWQTCSIDFSNAFVQARLQQPVWIHIPRGFHSNPTTPTCLKLHKSLYGSRQLRGCGFTMCLTRFSPWDSNKLPWIHASFTPPWCSLSSMSTM